MLGNACNFVAAAPAVKHFKSMLQIFQKCMLLFGLKLTLLNWLRVEYRPVLLDLHAHTFSSSLYFK
jgi:hypothetical protein